MSETEGAIKSDYSDKNNNEQKKEGFHLGILTFDPLFVWIGLIYGLTR